MRELSLNEVEQVSGAFSWGWNDNATNWGAVAAWGGAGFVSGLRGGLIDAAVSAIGGGAADYVDQHFYFYF